MKKISKRAWMAMALAIALLAGLLVFVGEYVVNAKDWVTFPGSPHVYTGVNPDCGRIYDRSGTLLLNTDDGRVYSTDETVRRSTMHLLGDRDGYISAPLLKTYASKMFGFDVVNGLYTDEPGSVAARLTISAAVQSAAQQALAGYRGTIGVYNYKTGELLCAVTSPSYDPDNVPDVANDTTGSYEGVYVNRFFDAAYTPGSIFKLVTAAAALETIPAKRSSAGKRSSATAYMEALIWPVRWRIRATWPSASSQRSLGRKPCRTTRKSWGSPEAFPARATRLHPAKLTFPKRTMETLHGRASGSTPTR